VEQRILLASMSAAPADNPLKILMIPGKHATVAAPQQVRIFLLFPTCLPPNFDYGQSFSLRIFGRRIRSACSESHRGKQRFE
jgi:hypothetical protein